jgi:hypothetical protein
VPRSEKELRQIKPNIGNEIENVIQCRCTPRCTATGQSTNRAVPWTEEKKERLENGARRTLGRSSPETDSEKNAPKHKSKAERGGIEKPLKSL